ncbi:crustacean hyperglycemic hormone 1 precursor [Penaeus vannamei]|uniref:Crustacean hyperglycemic hormone 1 n=1 Tax=Penaeus vannamei TaxID=6689 RepID=A0A423S8M0_PENVA|nr:crustacean hyperglycemic hormone 1 precursor [Penaeus vannamei]
MQDADDRLYKATSTWLRRRADEEPRSRRFSPPDSSRRRGNDWGSTAVLVSLLLVFPASVLASWDGNEIPPSLPSSSESSPATSLAGAQTANKRSISFDSCTGVYDRELLVRLDRVCEDCYNLYRNTDVAVECRSNCFHNEVFLYCVDYMYRPRQRNQYRAALQRLGK